MEGASACACLPTAAVASGCSFHPRPKHLAGKVDALNQKPSVSILKQLGPLPRRCTASARTTKAWGQNSRLQFMSSGWREAAEGGKRRELQVTQASRSGRSENHGKGKKKTSSQVNQPSNNASTNVNDQGFAERLGAIQNSGSSQNQPESVGPSNAGQSPSFEEDNSLWVKIIAGAAALGLLASVAVGNLVPQESGFDGRQSETAKVQATSEETKQLQTQAAAFEEILQRRPSDVEALEGAGVLYASLGDYNKAAEYLEKLVKARPTYVEALRLLAEVKFEARDFGRAAYMYKRAIKASPEESLELLKGLADTLISDNRPGEAVDDILKARERVRKAGLVQAAGASVEDGRTTELGASEGSRDLGEEDAGVASSVDEVPIDLLLAQAYQYWDKPSSAVAVYDELIADHPTDFRGYLAKSILLKQQSRDAEAEQILEKAKALVPESTKQLVKGIAPESE